MFLVFAVNIQQFQNDFPSILETLCQNSDSGKSSKRSKSASRIIHHWKAMNPPHGEDIDVTLRKNSREKST